MSGSHETILQWKFGASCMLKENSACTVLKQWGTVQGETGRLKDIILTWRWPTWVGSSRLFFVTLGKWLNLIHFCYLKDWSTNSLTQMVFVTVNWNDNWKLVVSTVQVLNDTNSCINKKGPIYLQHFKIRLIAYHVLTVTVLILSFQWVHKCPAYKCKRKYILILLSMT